MGHSHHNKCHNQTSALKKVHQYFESLLNEWDLPNMISVEECEALIKRLNHTRRSVEATYRRGGTTVVAINRRLVTVYRFGHYDNRPY